MNSENKNYLSLLLWIVILILVGSMIGYITKPGMTTWYSTLSRSTLTPPNYIFPVAWTILYAAIGACGWLIWHTSKFSHLRLVKKLYVMQLILNWSWTPVFFHYHLTGFALVILIAMDVAVSMIIYFGYVNVKSVSRLMTPYLIWIIFASYLNLYIWQYN